MMADEADEYFTILALSDFDFALSLRIGQVTQATPSERQPSAAAAAAAADASVSAPTRRAHLQPSHLRLKKFLPPP
jgi:hypothetical protein